MMEASLRKRRRRPMEMHPPKRNPLLASHQSMRAPQNQTQPWQQQQQQERRSRRKQSLQRKRSAMIGVRGATQGTGRAAGDLTGHQEVDPQERMMIADAGALLGSGPQAQGNTLQPTARDPPAPASGPLSSANPPPALASAPHHHASAPPPHTKGQEAPGSVHLLPGPNPEDVPRDPQVPTQSLPVHRGH